MTNDNYTQLFKVIGKLTRLYEVLSATAVAESPTITGTINQINPAPGTFSVLFRFQDNVTNNIRANFVPIMASNYLISSAVLNMFSTPLTANTKATDVITALSSEMVNDGKTLTTKGTTGIVSFLLQINPIATLPQSDTATFSDNTYVTDAVI